VHQRRRLERVAWPFLPHVACCQTAQLLIDDRDQSSERRVVPVADLRQHLGDLAAYVDCPAIVDQTGDFLLACIGSEDRCPGWTVLAPEHMPILFFQARLKPQPILEDCAAARFQPSAIGFGCTKTSTRVACG
jgi:hypothetical protein